LQSQLAGLESSLLGQRESLDLSPAEFKKFVDTAKAKLVKDFNEPLKEAQAKLQGIALGGVPNDTVEKAKLMVQVAVDEIQKLGESFGWTKEQIARLQAGAKAKIAAQQSSQQYTDLATIASATGDTFGAGKSQLNSNLVPRFEWSNEVWNGG